MIGIIVAIVEIRCNLIISSKFEINNTNSEFPTCNYVQGFQIGNIGDKFQKFGDCETGPVQGF